MRYVTATAAAVLSLSTIAHAQWVNDATTNTLIAGGEGLQAEPRIVARSDDGAFVSWFASADAPTYWTLHLNRLKPTGEALWGAGVPVSAKVQSTAEAAKIPQVEYDLKADFGGNAVLAFTDFGVPGVQNRNVQVYRVSPFGAQMWGAEGVTLTTDSTFKRDPRIVQTSDGKYSVVWFVQGNFTTIPSKFFMQRLNDAGMPELAPGGAEIVVGDAVNRAPDRFEVVASDNGSVIVAWVRQFSSSSSALRHIVAQKFGPDGLPLWNAGQPVTVCDQNVPLQTLGQNYPRVALTATPGGGAALAWFDVRAGANTHSVYAQRLDSAGAPVWVANGVAASTNSTRFRIDPAIAHDATGTWVFWREMDNIITPSQYGVFAQRIDATGTRTFGEDGAAVRAMSATNATFIRAAAADGAGAAFWFEEPAGPNGGQLIVGTRIDATGAPLWVGGTVTACSVLSTKNFNKHPLDTTNNALVPRDSIALTLNSEGDALLAWQDNRTDGNDLFAQRVRRTGELGNVHTTPCIADFDDSGISSIDDLFLYFNAWFTGDPGANVDGQPGVFIDDLFVFLNAWFTGCP